MCRRYSASFGLLIALCSYVEVRTCSNMINEGKRSMRRDEPKHVTFLILYSLRRKPRWKLEGTLAQAEGSVAISVEQFDKLRQKIEFV